MWGGPREKKAFKGGAIPKKKRGKGGGGVGPNFKSKIVEEMFTN